MEFKQNKFNTKKSIIAILKTRVSQKQNQIDMEDFSILKGGSFFVCFLHNS